MSRPLRFEGSSVAGVVVALIASAGPTVFAQGTAPTATSPSEASTAVPEDADRTERARTHFEAGFNHFRDRRFRESIREFELAAQLVPSADLWFNIARAHEELSEHAAAVEYYRLYLRDRVDPPDRESVEALIARLESVLAAERERQSSQPTYGRLRVRANRDDALATVDGRDVGRAPMEEPSELAAGPHDLEVRSPGRVPARARVHVAAGATTAAYVDLAPMTSYRAVRGKRTFTWIVGGAAIGAFIGSIVMGVVANGRGPDADDDDVEAEAARADRRDAAKWSDALLGTAVVTGLGAAILYFVEGRSVGTERVRTEASADRVSAW